MHSLARKSKSVFVQSMNPWLIHLVRCQRDTKPRRRVVHCRNHNGRWQVAVLRMGISAPQARIPTSPTPPVADLLAADQGRLRSAQGASTLGEAQANFADALGDVRRSCDEVGRALYQDRKGTPTGDRLSAKAAAPMSLSITAVKVTRD